MRSHVTPSAERYSTLSEPVTSLPLPNVRVDSASQPSGVRTMLGALPAAGTSIMRHGPPLWSSRPSPVIGKRGSVGATVPPSTSFAPPSWPSSGREPSTAAPFESVSHAHITTRHATNPITERWAIVSRIQSAPMKVIDQARLGFREGKSDKVYEVDLVEVASGQFVVNFRYGRRGSVLREGTKTALPVSLEKARVVFKALVAEKTKGGYLPTADADAAPAPERARPQSNMAETQARKERAVLAALAMGQRSVRPLYLTVRSVGEHGLSEAEPLLLELLVPKQAPNGMKLAVFRHFVIAALARCGSVVAAPALTAIAGDAKAPRHLRDVARLALVMTGGAQEPERMRASLPAELRPSASSDASALVGSLERLLAERPAQAHAAVFTLYLGSASQLEAAADPEGEIARRVVLAIARVAGLSEGGLGLLRALTWAAEIRRDAQLFAVLVRRFDQRVAGDVRPTVHYFRRRASRTLRRLGSIASPDYPRLASELLLTYRAEDAEPVRDTGFGCWDAWARYHALNFVLYGNSPRYERANHSGATWRCRDDYRPGQPAPNAREESFPALWDRAPEALWRLGCSDAAPPVIHFATRALRAQTAFLAQLPDEALGDAMANTQLQMRQLAFDVARARPVSVALARGALASRIREAEEWVVRWAEASPDRLASEPELLALLVTMRSAELRERVHRLLATLAIDAATAQRLVSHAVAILMQLTAEPGADERAASAAALLLRLVPRALSQLGLAVIRDLFGHPLPAVAELGAQLVLQRARASTLEHDLLDALLASPHAGVRALGARIVADTPPELIKDDVALLVHLALSDNAELRQGTRALLAEVARLYPEVGLQLASQLIDALLAPQPAGVPAHVVSLLRHELRACLPARDAQSVLALVGALSPHAREAGGMLLTRVSPDEIELDAIVRLANHEILLVRQGAWALASGARQRFLLAPLALARLCDANWEDSRAFAAGFVRGFPASALAPDTVIAICDSVNPAVQAFGQGLLRELWQDEHASRYLLRLSEHPSTLIQQLVSGLLQQHAAGKLDMLQQLVPYFATVLSQVNRGGVAKQRVLAFLRAESTASAEAAGLLAPLLDRQSLTSAVSQRAPLIATMVGLHARYPEVPLPITAIEPPLHARRERGV
jgi:hypothetical protein